jgi:hypothetical protein
LPQLFTRSANLWARLTLWGVIGAVCAFGATSWALHQSDWATGEGRVLAQPVPFSHEHHVRGVGLDCRYCHTTVEEGRFAGVPAAETCMHCHAHVFPDAAYLAPVRESWRSGAPLAWQRVHDLADFTYFDHGAHVQAGVGCETCHGRVDRMALTAQGASLTMDWCVDCHRDPAPHLRPTDAVFDVGWRPAGGEAVAAHADVAADTSCSVCHR